MLPRAPAMREVADVLIGGISLGLGGQANHGAANGWFDAYARTTVAQGRPTTSVQWGAWSGGGGMAAGDAGIIQRMERLGVGVISPQQGLAVLEALTRSAGRSVMAANPFLWDRFLRRTVPVPPLFGEFAHLAPTEVVSGGTPSAKSTPVKASISLLAASAVEAKVAGCVSDILGKEVAINEPLIDAGLDSLGAVELRDAVNAAVDMELPSTVVFDYPSVGAMSGFIVSQMHPEGEAGTEIVDQPVVVRSSEQRETLGVVGSSSRTSRDALRADSALDAISRVPLARWCSTPGRYCACPGALFGSFVADADMFDSEVFKRGPPQRVFA